MNNRQSIRLKGYDYSKPGYYFITICTQNRVHRFGEISGGVMRLNDAGNIVEDCWNELAIRFPHVSLDSFVVMPNHIHGIITAGAPLAGARFIPTANADESNVPTEQRATARVAPTIGDIVGAYKSLCVKKLLQWINDTDPTIRFGTLWQRNYWEHIIRDEQSLYTIRQYIRNNPAKWQADCFMENNNELGEDQAIYVTDPYILLYQAPDPTIKLNTHPKDETAWLTPTKGAEK